jgi:hypothetical protein
MVQIRCGALYRVTVRRQPFWLHNAARVEEEEEEGAASELSLGWSTCRHGAACARASNPPVDAAPPPSPLGGWPGPSSLPVLRHGPHHA